MTSDSSFASLWRDWEIGLRAADGKLLAPLRVLECPDKVPGGSSLRDIWRSGNPMCVHIKHVKLVVYALDRRQRGAPRTQADVQAGSQYSPMPFSQACGDLEAAAVQHGKKPDSMSQMARHVIPALQEMTPDQYERYCKGAQVSLFNPLPARPQQDSGTGQSSAGAASAATAAAATAGEEQAAAVAAAAAMDAAPGTCSPSVEDGGPPSDMEVRVRL
jgi:hypothetical protein